MSALADFSVLRPEVRGSADEARRASARELLAALPVAETPDAVREAWWRLVTALTAETLVRPPGCPSGHHVSELRWHRDKRCADGGWWVCKQCRRDRAAERGWA